MEKKGEERRRKVEEKSMHWQWQASLVNTILVPDASCLVQNQTSPLCVNVWSSFYPTHHNFSLLKGLPWHKHKTQVQSRSLRQKGFTKLQPTFRILLGHLGGQKKWSDGFFNYSYFQMTTTKGQGRWRFFLNSSFCNPLWFLLKPLSIYGNFGPKLVNFRLKKQKNIQNWQL